MPNQSSRQGTPQVRTCRQKCELLDRSICPTSFWRAIPRKFLEFANSSSCRIDPRGKWRHLSWEKQQNLWAFWTILKFLISLLIKFFSLFLIILVIFLIFFYVFDYLLIFFDFFDFFKLKKLKSQKIKNKKGFDFLLLWTFKFFWTLFFIFIKFIIFELLKKMIFLGSL